MMVTGVQVLHVGGRSYSVITAVGFVSVPMLIGYYSLASIICPSNRKTEIDAAMGIYTTSLASDFNLVFIFPPL